MRFTLVHGGFHGAWCWERLIPELHNLGHDAVAMDLPGHGTRCGEKSTLAGYRDAVLEVLQAGDVLVGHSTGCVATMLAVDVLPSVQHLIFLAGPLPVAGKPLTYGMVGEGGEDSSSCDDGPGKYLRRVSDDGQFFLLDSEDAIGGFYHDCDDEVAAWAFERLTPQSVDVMVTERVRSSHFLRPEIPRSFIRCTKDRIFPRRISDHHIERLGVTPVDIDTSHSPFLSRPAELARLLVQVADEPWPSSATPVRAGTQIR